MILRIGVSPPAGTFQIRYLLTHPEFARRTGMMAENMIRENFMITSDVKR
jgi:hypothetical protein